MCHDKGGKIESKIYFTKPKRNKKKCIKVFCSTYLDPFGNFKSYNTCRVLW